jgi:hypothetical protein
MSVSIYRVSSNALSQSFQFSQPSPNRILSLLWSLHSVSSVTLILHRGSRMFRENIRLKCQFRIPNGNRAEICGELRPPQGHETSKDLLG